MRMFAAAALVAALVVSAVAADQGIGFGCDNACPLAKQANACRSFGLEARGASKIARAELVAVVEKNLERI
jgi:hypothetical protein